MNCQYVNMNKQEEKIAKAALAVFSRYGIGRATMSDIAKEAGLVRQTLYTVYSSKDDVLCAAIRYFSETSMSAIKHTWGGTDDLGEKLDIYFEQAIIQFFVVIHSSPDANEMMSGYNDAGKAEIARMRLQKIEAIAEIFEPFAAAITNSGLTVEQLADFFQSASMNLRNDARNEEHLRSLLRSLKLTILSLTERKY